MFCTWSVFFINSETCERKSITIYSIFQALRIFFSGDENYLTKIKHQYISIAFGAKNFFKQTQFKIEEFDENNKYASP